MNNKHNESEQCDPIKLTDNERAAHAHAELKAKGDKAVEAYLSEQAPLDLPIWISKKR